MLLHSLLLSDRLPGHADRAAWSGSARLVAAPAGHPEYRHADGIETTTGPLAQGLADAVGMALAERIMNAELRRRAGRSLHLCLHGRWLPDGGHQPRGHFAWPAI